MTNYNERLENRLKDLFHAGHMYGETGMSDPVEAIDEAKQAILDWHNEQIEAVLDRLELSMRGKTVVDTAEGWQKFIKRHVVAAIEAERNNLTMANSPQLKKLKEK